MAGWSRRGWGRCSRSARLPMRSPRRRASPPISAPGAMPCWPCRPATTSCSGRSPPPCSTTAFACAGGTPRCGCCWSRPARVACFLSTPPLGLAPHAEFPRLCRAGHGAGRSRLARRPGRRPATPAAFRRRRLVALYRPQPRSPSSLGVPRSAPTGASLAGAVGLLAIAGIVAWSLLRRRPHPVALPGHAGRAGSRATARRAPAGTGQIRACRRARTPDDRRTRLSAGRPHHRHPRQRLGLPEYRLRRLINQALGYRNFNSFVNHYRIAEAKAALADPRQAEVPVLTIALDAGFSSLGPFNRAFKAETGMTPSEYRRLKPAKSRRCRNRPADFRIRPARFRTRREAIWRPTRFALTPGHRRAASSGRAVHAPFHFRRCCRASHSSCCRAAPASTAPPDVATGFVSHQLCSATFVSRGRAGAVLSRGDRPDPVAARAACPATRSIARTPR